MRASDRRLPRSAHPARAFALALCGASMLLAAWAPATAQGAGLTVVPIASNSAGLSYFKLSAHGGELTRAGAVELRNPTSRALRVALDPVAGATIDTLGSTYAAARSRARPHGPAAWVRLAARRVSVPARGRLVLPVQVAVPVSARPGDYLAGISVEALGQGQGARSKGVSIASVVRYAIGVEVSLPGPRHGLIRFTGAGLQRQPSGLAFLLRARNPGNVILQGVHGRALITRGARTVASVPLGPGTFVTGTSIAYPVLARGETATAGTVYRVRAYLRYAGGIARLDTLVRFGRADAAVQKTFAPPSRHASAGLPAWLVGVLGAAAALIVVLVLLALRRRRATGGAPLPALEAALRRARERGLPLTLLVVGCDAPVATRSLARTVRERLRHSDSLHGLGERTLLVIAPDTNLETARVLGEDVRRHLEQATASSAFVDVIEAGSDSGAAELLRRERAARDARRVRGQRLTPG